ncbi:MAG TPA: MmcQ/YjbR family DNA-binding protein [Pseudonocardia sp.]|nr:MmcQ/YjbR family DNA-binding protein [Pseudonocardia sp.]
MPTWNDVVGIATALPGVEESTWYRTPAVAVRGRRFARLRTEAEGRLVLLCGLDEKAALLACGDPAFSTTSHYDGYGAILVDLDAVDPAQLRELVVEAWRITAPVRLRRAFDARRA